MKSALVSMLVMGVLLAFVSGCFTAAGAWTEKTYPDGTRTVSKVHIVGTGDKASQVAAEGMFADGTAEDLGAGVKKANASQESTGIEGTLKGLGSLLQGLGQFWLATQTAGVAANSTKLSGTAITSTESVSVASADADTTGDIAYSTDGYGGVPGANGIGVYGSPTCSRCRSYRAAHSGVEIINVQDTANRSALWAALKSRGYTGTSVGLPVAVTEAGYTLAVK